MTFVLHPRLLADTAWIADWPLSRLLLMNDTRYPWVLLVPRRPDVSELFDLDEEVRATLMGEIARAAARLKSWPSAGGTGDKINIGMIGNMVPQLHIHIVARRRGDPAWPGTVWGAGQAVPYGADELARVVGTLREHL